jgi:hypothetical protein
MLQSWFWRFRLLTGFDLCFFTIVWSAQVDGPGLQSGLRSKEYLTPLRPIIVAPPSQEWVYKATLFKERKSTAIAEVQAKLPKQTFCPGEFVFS